MNVFLSWSGSRSNKIASALNNWIPKVIQSARPWMSAEDIATGSRWNAELNQQLENTAIGIICITPENQQSIWLHFEAGALSKLLSDSKVMPLLHELTPGQVSGPMSQFQSVTLTKEGVSKIINSVNDSLDDKKINESDLLEIFDVWWPKLEDQLNSIGGHVEHIPKRETSEMLEELIDIAREQRRNSEEQLLVRENKKNDLKKMFDSMQKMTVEMEERSKDSVNLEKQKLAYLANIGKGEKTALSELTLQDLPKELASLIDRQGENPMKDMLGVFQNMQESLLKEPENVDVDQNETKKA